MGVYDLEYYFDNDYEPEDTVGIRSILVQTGADEFHEIYAAERAGGPVFPTRVVSAGQEWLLVSSSDGGGNTGGVSTAAFILHKDGIIPFNFLPIWEAAEKAIPNDKTPWLPASAFDFPALRWRSLTSAANGGKLGCCEGGVTVTFRIDATGRVQVTDAEYDPDTTEWPK